MSEAHKTSSTHQGDPHAQTEIEQARAWLEKRIGYHVHGDEFENISGGLDALIAACLRRVGMQEQEKDFGAGLIHATDTGHGDTLPRLTYCGVTVDLGEVGYSCVRPKGHTGDHSSQRDRDLSLYKELADMSGTPLEEAHQHFCDQIDRGLEHYAGKIAKRAFRNAINALKVGYHGNQSLSDSEPVGTERSVQEESIKSALPPPAGATWLPIASAPKDGTHILGSWGWDDYNKEHVCDRTYWSEGDWRDPDDYDHEFTAPTYWQPLPPVPAPSEEK